MPFVGLRICAELYSLLDEEAHSQDIKMGQLVRNILAKELGSAPGLAQPGGRGRSKRRQSKEYHELATTARLAVADAVRLKLLPPIKTLCCYKCERPATGYHHYMGYAKECRLLVIPLCHACHGEQHTSHAEETTKQRIAARRQAYPDDIQGTSQPSC